MDYKEKLEEAKELYKTANADQKYALELLFPELKRNEEERIRKTLIEYFNAYPKDYFGGLKKSYIVAWLEKQGEQKPSIIDFKAKDWYVSKVYGKIYDMTYNPTDKVEPKFKVNDWIIKNNDSSINIDYSCCKVTKVENGNYTIESIYGYKGYNTFETFEKDYHLWSIADAKDGDVLYSLDSKQSFIFKHRKPNEQAEVYCGINIYGKFFVGNTKDCIITTDKYIPATKEQCDTLEKAMADAGFTFDFEKKELKKVEDVINKTEGWLDNLCDYLKDSSSEYISEVKDVINKLKSLKPQNRRKPSDEQIKVCKEVYADVLSAKGFDAGAINSELNRLEEQLKKLREE